MIIDGLDGKTKIIRTLIRWNERVERPQKETYEDISLKKRTDIKRPNVCVHFMLRHQKASSKLYV